MFTALSSPRVHLLQRAKGSLTILPWDVLFDVYCRIHVADIIALRVVSRRAVQFCHSAEIAQSWLCVPTLHFLLFLIDVPFASGRVAI